MNIFILNNRFNKPSNFIFLSAQLLEKLLYLSVLLFVLFFNLGSDKIIVSATATTPTTGGVDLPGTTSESNVTEVSVVMTPKYSEDGHNYYSLMTNFQGLDHGMYTGLQTTGNLGNNGPGVGNLFIFSSWDATSAYPAQGATATPFDGEGIGYSIRMPYDWSIDIPYLIKVYRTEKDSKTNTYKWAVSITNQNTQQTTVIGEIPAPVGVPEFIAPSDMFHERYIGEDPKCTDTSSAIEKIGVIFSDLKANGKPAILGTPTSSRRTGTTTPENLWLYQPCQPYIHNRVVGQSFYSAIGLNGAEFNSLIPSAGNNGNTDTGGGTNNDSGSSSSNSGSSSLTNGDIKSIVNGTEWYKQDIVCTATTNTNNTSSALSSKDLTEDQKIAQTFLVGFRASDVETGVMKAVAEKYKIGGIFILENNNNEKTFTKELFDGINSKVGIPLIVASDEEGGAVQRLRGLYEMPSALEMGAMTEAQVEEIGKTLGTKLLSATGVNTVLSPTLDIDYPNANSVAVHELARTFGSDPANITSKAGAFARGLSSTGIKPTYKHFPGLGSANGDSDFEISTSKPISELMLKDVLPFKDLVNQYNGMVMLDGAIVPGLTTGVDVASTSPEAVSLLRNDLKFNGIIMTDDLAATGVQYELPEAVTKALQAGVDMPIFVGEADAESKIQSAIDAVKAAKVDVQARVDKIISYKNGTSTPAANSIPTLNLTNGGAAASSGYSSTSGQSIPNIYLTAYTQHGPNRPRKRAKEGGTGSSIPGLDGSSTSRTLDDFEAAINGTKPSLGTEEQKQKYMEKPYITLAGATSNHRKAYLIPAISWTNKNQEKRTLNNVLAYVHDWGSAFASAPEGRYDVAIGQDYPDSITNSTGGQYFQGSGNPSGIQLIPVDPETLSYLPSPGSNPESCSSSSSSSRLAVTSNSSGNDSIIWNFFAAKGLSGPQIAGIIGNMKQESSLNPDTHQSGGPGYGLIQWGYDLPGEEQLKDWMNKAGITGDHKNINTQLEMVWWHMNNLAPTSRRNMYATYKTIADVEEATTYFEDKMEAAGKPNMPNRIKYAKEALAKFGAVNGTVTPVIVNSDDPGLNFVSIIEDKTVLKGDINV